MSFKASTFNRTERNAELKSLDDSINTLISLISEDSEYLVSASINISDTGNWLIKVISEKEENISIHS